MITTVILQITVPRGCCMQDAYVQAMAKGPVSLPKMEGLSTNPFGDDGAPSGGASDASGAISEAYPPGSRPVQPTTRSFMTPLPSGSRQVTHRPDAALPSGALQQWISW